MVSTSSQSLFGRQYDGSGNKIRAQSQWAGLRPIPSANSHYPLTGGRYPRGGTRCPLAARTPFCEPILQVVATGLPGGLLGRDNGKT